MHYDFLIQSMTTGVEYDPVPTENAFDGKASLANKINASRKLFCQ